MLRESRGGLRGSRGGARFLAKFIVLLCLERVSDCAAFNSLPGLKEGGLPGLKEGGLSGRTSLPVSASRAQVQKLRACQPLPHRVSMGVSTTASADKREAPPGRTATTAPSEVDADGNAPSGRVFRKFDPAVDQVHLPPKPR